MLSIFRICGQLHRQIEVAFGMHVSDCFGPECLIPMLDWLVKTRSIRIHMPRS
jgi:hypothetical protein